MRLNVCPIKLSRFCWQSLAVVLVLFALVVSLIRGLLPQLDQVRQELVDYIQGQYQVAVQVGQLDAQWQAFGPSLNVENLIIPPQEKLPFTLIINKVQVKLDFWQTILSASPQIEQVQFNGVHIALNVDELTSADGNPDDATKATDVDWLYRLLLEQLDRYSITDATVQLLSSQHDYRPIHLKDIRWRNLDGRHRGEGALRLDDDVNGAEQLSLKVDLYGDGRDPDSIRGQLYVAAQSLDLGEWASRQPNPYNPDKKMALEGVINLQAWANVSNRAIDSGLVLFQPSWLEWHLKDAEQRFDVNGGSLAWHPTDKGWLFSSQGLSFVTNGQHWPELKIRVANTQGNLFADINQLQPQNLLPLLPLVPGLTRDNLLAWQSMQPKGNIGPITLSQLKGQPLAAKVNLRQLTWQAASHVPGMSAIDAQLYWQNEQLTFALPEQSYLVDFQQEFSAPLQFTAAPIVGVFDPANARLRVPKLHLSNDDLALTSSVQLDFKDSAHMALLAELKLYNIANAGRYFPRHAMGEPLADYLESAIKAGQSQDAKVVWHGNFSAFPFAHNDGIFQASFSLTDAEYAFQPDWPAVTNLSLDALFENDRMDLWVDKGRLLKVPADGAHVFIPEMGLKTELKVQADLSTTGPDATRVLKASPLASSIGTTLSVVQVQGKVQGSLDISLPFHDDAEPDVRGKIHFDNSPVYISEPGVQLNGVTGDIQFANAAVEGQGITARLFKQPLTLGFSTKDSPNGLGLNVDLTGRWNLAKLPDTLANPLSAYYSGNLKWNGKLKMVFGDSGYSLQANVSSNLLGVELALPGEFAKDAQTPMALNAELIGDDKASSLGIKLAEQLEFWGGFERDYGNKLAAYDLILGRVFLPGDTLQKHQGHLQIDLPKADIVSWLPIINGFVAAGDSTSDKARSLAASNLKASSVAATEDLLNVNAPKAEVPSTGELNRQTKASTINGRAQVNGGQEDDPQVNTLPVNDAAISDLSAGIALMDNIELEASAIGSVSDTNTSNFPVQTGFMPALIAIDARIKAFDLLGQGLSDLKFTAAPQQGFWRFNATAKEFDGQIDFYPDWLSQGLKVVATRFQFAPKVKSPQAAHYSEAEVISSLPPLALDIDDFSFYDKPLGHLVLQATPDALGYKIQTLSLDSPDAQLQGTGTWQNQHGSNRTEFDFTLNAKKFDALSQRLNTDPGLKDAPLALTANLSWQGAPYAFSLETLGGAVRFDFGKGHLSEISDKGARIFSLFSLDSLLRKLSLDFSDVFGKGLYFDSFSGDLALENGVVKTTNTKMDAIAGEMKVRGFTDLTTESLNYDIRFVPQLASSVPTVVLLSTSAWTLGIGAFALTKVLEPVIEVISEIRFRLTGTMTDPKLEELERKSKEIEIPESILPRTPAPVETSLEAIPDNIMGSPVPIDSASVSVEASQGISSEGTLSDISPQPVPAADKPLVTEPETLPPVIQSPAAQDDAPLAQPDPVKVSLRVIESHSGYLSQKYRPVIAAHQRFYLEEKHANQLVTMSEQSRCRCEPAIYCVAA